MMTKQELVYYHNYLWLQYKDKMEIIFDKTVADDDFGAIVSFRQVILPESIKRNQSEWTLFAFLHEIGHIITNTNKMLRCQMEYLATQWALDKAKEMGIKVPKSTVNVYQNYIWRWRRTNAKNVPAMEELTLKY